jgi:hypothetical protein
MTEPKSTVVNRTPNKRGRRVALLLFAVGFVPLILASVMYYTGWLNPAGTTNNGDLIKPAVPVADLGLIDPDGKPIADRFGPDVAEPSWLMLVAAADCQSECEQMIYLARQVNTALGKNQNRLERAAFLQKPPADLSEYPDMPLLESNASNPLAWPDDINLRQTPQIYLVDPFGNVMMHYGADHTGKEMLEDLKQLMKLSQIG